MKNIVFFHTQEKDFSNKIYKKRYTEMVDIHHLPGTYIMCHYDTLKIIERKIQSSGEQKLFYLGNGNYHYLTLPIIAQISEPFTLVLFDHHNDAGYLPLDNITSCGSWVQDAIEQLQYLEEVIIIGAESENNKEVEAHIQSKIKLNNEKDLSKEAIAQISLNIRTRNIYISVDRDILSEKEVRTNWNQGTLCLDQLNHAIEMVAEGHDLLGADVCGDMVWDYQTMQKNTMQPVIEKSIRANNRLFKKLGELVV